METLASRVKAFREHKGLSQVEFAAACGLEQSHISNIETNRAKPLFQNVAKILEAFPELNPDWVVGKEVAMIRKNGTGCEQIAQENERLHEKVRYIESQLELANKLIRLLESSAEPSDPLKKLHANWQGRAASFAAAR